MDFEVEVCVNLQNALKYVTKSSKNKVQSIFSLRANKLILKQKYNIIK